jgi:hypothetical protein
LILINITQSPSPCHQQPVQPAVAGADLDQLGVAQAAGPLDGDFANAVAGFDDEFDRVLPALGRFDRVLDAVIAVGAAVHRDDLCADDEACLEQGAVPDHAGQLCAFADDAAE